MSVSNPGTIRPPNLVLLFLVSLVLWGCVIALGFHVLLWGPNPLNYHLEGLVIIWVGFFGVLFFCNNNPHYKKLVINASYETKFCFWAIVLGLGFLFRLQVLLADPYRRYRLMAS